MKDASISAAGDGSPNVRAWPMVLGGGDARLIELTDSRCRQYLFVRHGCGSAELDGWRTSVAGGETLFIPSGTRAMVGFPEPAEAFLFGIADDFLVSRVVPALGVSLASYWEDFHSPKKLSHWTAAREAADRDRIWNELRLAARRLGSCSDAAVAAYVFLILFEKNNRPLRDEAVADAGVASATEQMPYSALSIVTRFRGLIEQHIASPWSVNDYCRALGVRPAELGAACKEAIGRTPGSLIQEHRLLRAMRELRHTAASAAEIAYRVGFNDPAYFSRFFRRHTGRSPVEFRRDPSPPTLQLDGTPGSMSASGLPRVGRA